MNRGMDALPDHHQMMYGMAAILFLSGKNQDGTFCLEEAYQRDPGGIRHITTRFPRLSDISAFMEVVDRLIQ